MKPVNAILDNNYGVSPQSIILEDPFGGSTCGLTQYFKFTYSTYYLDYYYYSHDDSIKYANSYDDVATKSAGGITIIGTILSAAFASSGALIWVTALNESLFIAIAVKTTLYYTNLRNTVNYKNAVNSCGTITVVKRYFSGPRSYIGIYSQGL